MLKIAGYHFATVSGAGCAKQYIVHAVVHKSDGSVCQAELHTAGMATTKSFGIVPLVEGKVVRIWTRYLVIKWRVATAPTSVRVERCRLPVKFGDVFAHHKALAGAVRDGSDFDGLLK